MNPLDEILAELLRGGDRPDNDTSRVLTRPASVAEPAEVCA